MNLLVRTFRSAAVIGGIAGGCSGSCERELLEIRMSPLHGRPRDPLTEAAFLVLRKLAAIRDRDFGLATLPYFRPVGGKPLFDANKNGITF